jgi:hypothetical protein
MPRSRPLDDGAGARGRTGAVLEGTGHVRKPVRHGWRVEQVYSPAPAAIAPPAAPIDPLASLRQAWAGHYREAVTGVAGAIVCAGAPNVMASYQTAGMLFSRMAEVGATLSLPASMRAVIETYGDPGQSTAPNLEAYGCIMVPPHRRVLVLSSVLIPWIAGEVDGRVVIGATIGPMIK